MARDVNHERRVPHPPFSFYMANNKDNGGLDFYLFLMYHSNMPFKLRWGVCGSAQGENQCASSFFHSPVSQSQLPSRLPPFRLWLGAASTRVANAGGMRFSAPANPGGEVAPIPTLTATSMAMATPVIGAAAVVRVSSSWSPSSTWRAAHVSGGFNPAELVRKESSALTLADSVSAANVEIRRAAILRDLRAVFFGTIDNNNQNDIMIAAVGIPLGSLVFTIW